MEDRIRGRTVVVTGASSGFGEHAAGLLAARGARVALVARSADRLADLARALSAAGGRAVPIPADLSSATERREALKAVEHELGPVDVLVNNAGYGRYAHVAEMEPDEVRAMFEVNVIAAIDLAHLLVPGMQERGRGHVINVGSIAGYVAAPPLTVYAATKHALAGATAGLRRELRGDRGVFVTLLTAAPARTAFGQTASGHPVDPNRVPGGIRPERVAAAIVSAIRRPRREVFVPAYHRPVFRIAHLLPRVVDVGASIQRWQWVRHLPDRGARRR